MAKNNDFYKHHVRELNAQYLSVTSQDVHQSWLSDVSKKGYALDIGCGVGRDAAYLDSEGYDVVAIDPCVEMLTQAQENFPDADIIWVQDSLPALPHIAKLKRKYSLILLSAVWMHVPKSQRQRSLQKLSAMLAPKGKIIITLRHGEFTDGRVAYAVSAEELRRYAFNYGLSFRLHDKGVHVPDQLNREAITWQTVELTLPDDGTGAFPLLRNIVINDAKAATYKIALIRSILRIAEGHPGAVITHKCTSEHVALPFGLVAMYWLKLFKPLIDTFGMQQSSDSSKGLGFVKDNGWRKLAAYSNNDFFVGAVHIDNAKAIHSTFLHITALISNMPARYITLPGTQKAVFEVERASPKPPKQGVVLDYEYLLSFGVFYMPTQIWSTLSNYSCWIEPAFVNEWVRIMQSFQNNKDRNFSLDDYQLALKWEDATRSTNIVRERITELKKAQDVHCVWSRKKIATRYDVDHTFPFVRWPNNDLWNLSPALQWVNLQKSDKLASNTVMLDAKDQILHFWKIAWSDEKQFFTQSNIALPELAVDNDSFEDVFEAMLAQRDRIKRVQQLNDWDGVRNKV